MKYIITLLLIGLNLHTFSQEASRDSFSKEEILKDLSYLWSSLEETHYDLYAYTSKEAFKENFESVKNSVKKDSFNLVEAMTIFQRVISKASNGHTEITFPSGPYINYLYGGGTLFPLEIAIENGQYLIRKNWSNNEGIKVGDELVSIDGLKIEELMSKIYPLISAERPYFKNAKFEFYSLPRYVWQLFGEAEEFEVKVKSGNEIKKHSISAIKGIEDYEMRRTDVLGSQLMLKFYDEAAYLNPGGFGGDLEKYKTFIDSAFNVINEKEIENLIVDLRNNPGGDDAFSDYLVSYIADRPFKWNSGFTLKSSRLLKEDTRKNFDTTQAYWREVLTHEDGEIYPFDFGQVEPQPEEKRFNEDIYVLVNRQSHSQSTVAAAQIQDYGFAKIVGEETGEYPTLYASVFRYPLPSTGVTVQVSKGRIVRVNGSEKEEGVIPDIVIRDHLLDENDEILDGLLDRLR